MRGHEFRRLVNSVASLSASSEKTLQYGRVHCALSGMCSPHVSHRRIEYTDAFDDGTHAAIVANSKYALAIWPHAAHTSEASPFGADWLESVHADAPVALVQPVTEMLTKYLGWRMQYGTTELLRVAFCLPRVASWDEGCRPVYAPAPAGTSLLPLRVPTPPETEEYTPILPPTASLLDESADAAPGHTVWAGANGLLRIDASHGQITASRDGVVTSGCQSHHIDWWSDTDNGVNRGTMLARAHGYSDAEIAEYRGHFARIREWFRERA